MLKKYGLQDAAKELLGAGDLIYFTLGKSSDNAPISGTVKTVDHTNETVVIEDVNGEVCSLTAAFDELTLYYDTAWDNGDKKDDESSLDGSRYIRGDYAIVGVKNAFNKKTSFWISRKGYTDAYYCFSANEPKEVAYQLRNWIGYVRLYEDRHKKFEQT